MIDEQIKEQASLYVAGALPANEAREFEAVLGGSLELQLLVKQLRHSLDALVAALPRRTPPPSLRARLMHEVEAQAAAVVIPLASPQSAWWETAVPWAIAACLTFLCVYLATERRWDRRQVQLLEQKLSEATALTDAAEQKAETQRTEFQQQRDQLNQRVLQQAAEQQKQQTASEGRLIERVRQLEKRNADLAAKVPASSTKQNPALSPPNLPGDDIPAQPGPGRAPPVSTQTLFLGVLRPRVPGSPAIGAVAWEALEQRGTILIDQLPPASADKDYQLWLFVDATPVSGGVLPVDVSGHLQGTYIAAQPRIDAVNQFAITLERKGGVIQPEGSIVMASN